MTTTTTTHTPTPWTVKNDELYSATIFSGSPEFFPLAKVTSDLTAAHIVRCVNLFPQMIEAIEQAAIQYHDGSQDEICTDENPCGFCAVLARAREEG